MPRKKKTAEEIELEKAAPPILGHDRRELYRRAMAGDPDAQAIITEAINQAVAENPEYFEPDPVISKLSALSIPRDEW